MLHFLTVGQKGAARLYIIMAIGVYFMAGCATVSPPVVLPMPTVTVPAPAFVTAPSAVALPQLVEAERQASIDKNLGLLAALWAEDSRIVDGRGTRQTEDDYVWAGRAAVLDRYGVAVFPNPPPPLQLHGDLSLQVKGDTATGQHGQDRWRFVKRGNRWWLAELRYSQP